MQCWGQKVWKERDVNSNILVTVHQTSEEVERLHIKAVERISPPALLSVGMLVKSHA